MKAIVPICLGVVLVLLILSFGRPVESSVDSLWSNWDRDCVCGAHMKLAAPESDHGYAYECVACGRWYAWAWTGTLNDPCDTGLSAAVERADEAVERYHALAEKIADEYIDHLKEDVSRLVWVYDPNDPAYKFIAPAPKDWIDKFGDNERTRLLHSVSELRVVVAAQVKRLLVLESGLKDVDWDLLPRKTVTIETVPVVGSDPNEAK